MLSILICSLNERKKQLDHLMASLIPQSIDKAVSIHVETDDGKMSIGEKRNVLMKKAFRKYICYIDDDDSIASNYVDLVLDAIRRGNTTKDSYVDCIGMCGYLMVNGERTWQFRHSTSVTNWCKDKRAKIYFRNPNHLNPIRSDLAKRCYFPETNWGEDRSYSNQMKLLCQNEVFIEEPIYFYNQGNK